MGSRFTGEVTGIELFEGGVDVVEVEQGAATTRLSASISTIRVLGAELLGLVLDRGT